MLDFTGLSRLLWPRPFAAKIASFQVPNDADAVDMHLLDLFITAWLSVKTYTVFVPFREVQWNNGEDFHRQPISGNGEG